MKLNFNFPLRTLDGTPMKEVDGKDVMAGKILANSLVMQPQGEVAKFFDWAMSLHRGEEIDLDRADQQKMKDFIENNPSMVILVKKALLDVLAGKVMQIEPTIP
jgi:hypothetical protein